MDLQHRLRLDWDMRREEYGKQRSAGGDPDKMAERRECGEEGPQLDRPFGQARSATRSSRSTLRSGR